MRADTPERWLDVSWGEGADAPEAHVGRLEVVITNTPGALGTLSTGQRQRVKLAMAIAHDPELVMLDEPTDGLDPNQKHEVRGMIKRMGQNKAIIFSTHILEEVEAACTRAIIIDKGRIVADGTPKALTARSAHGRLDEVFRQLTTPDAEINVTAGAPA